MLAGVKSLGRASLPVPPKHLPRAPCMLSRHTSPAVKRCQGMISNAIARPAAQSSNLPNSQSSKASACSDVMSRLQNVTTLESSIGLPLTKDEQTSLLKCLQSSNIDVHSCLAQGLQALQDHIMLYLEEVGHTKAAELELVEGAMLLVEQLSLTDAQRPDYLDDGSQKPVIDGRWQMIFTTAGGWPRLQYIPVLEFFEICSNSAFKIDTQLGPVFTSFTGDLEWLSRDFLHYHVDQLKVEVAGLDFKLPAPIPDNDLKIYAVGEEISCARSTSGGLILMVKPF